MPEPTPQPEPTPNPPPAPPSDISVSKVRFDEVNDRMKAAEAALAKLQTEREQADEKRLQEEKKFEDLATKRATERDEWKAKAEAAEAARLDYETSLQAIADERVKELPEKLQARVPAADKASAKDRLAKIEEIKAVLAEVPHAAAPHGNAPGPKPRGAPSPAAALEEKKAELRRQGGYGRF